MQSEAINILRCPISGQRLRLHEAILHGKRIYRGWLVSEDQNNRYEIRDYIPRFVPDLNYADSFGMQWNKFRETQLDSFSGHSISGDRFWKATNWSREEITGKWVLDAGCGAGRFAEVALAAGAYVVAVDYSKAVDACYWNLKCHPKLVLAQADIYQLPLRKGFFSYVYSLGVLQHTPNVARAFAALPPMLRDGGRICVDIYEKCWKNMLLPKYWLRPVMTRVPKERLFTVLEALVPNLLRVNRMLGNFPVIGGALKRLVPVADYHGALPLTESQHLDWALLDTFDWFSPEFDNPQTSKSLSRWLKEAGLIDIEVIKAGHLVGRGNVPDASGD